MITQNGTVITEAKVDTAMQKELARSTRKFALTAVILGAIGLTVFFGLLIASAVLDYNNEDVELYVLIACFAVVTFVGAWLLYLLSKNEKQASNTDRVLRLEFFKSFFIANESVNGESVAVAKVYNSNIIKVKETQNYLFLFISNAQFYPVCKVGLEQNEIATLCSLFNLKHEGEPLTLVNEEYREESEINGDNENREGL